MLSAFPAEETLADFDFAVACGADLRGNLGDCGCPKHPMGGLGWRVGWRNSVLEKRKSVLLDFDAGRFLAGYDVDRIPPDVAEQNRRMLAGLQTAGLAAGNAAAPDLKGLSLFHEGDLRDYPFLGQLVSANVRSDEPRSWPRPWLVRTVEIAGRGSLRVGVTGVTAASVIPQGWTASDPEAALREVLPKLREQCDVVVILTYVPDVVEERIERLDGVDIIVAGQQEHPPDVWRLDLGTKLVLRTFPQTKRLAVAGWKFDEGFPKVRPSGAVFADVPLDSRQPTDEKAYQAEAEAKKAVDALRAKLFAHPAGG